MRHGEVVVNEYSVFWRGRGRWGCHEGSLDVDVIPRLRGCEEAVARKSTYAFLAQLNMIADVVGLCIYIREVDATACRQEIPRCTWSSYPF